ASQDIVLGVYYITAMPEKPDEKVIADLGNPSGSFDKKQVDAMRGLKAFRSPIEAMLAYDLGKIRIHDPIVVRLPQGQYVDMVTEQVGEPVPMPQMRRLVTTVGRLMF